MICIQQSTPKFQTGQLIHHIRYDYRGVIVAVDHRCTADEAWYSSNQTQPNANQPWYHVFVDGSMTTTYVAESNLEEDPSGEEVNHRLVPHYFSDFADGRYVRNDRQWEGW